MVREAWSSPDRQQTQMKPGAVGQRRTPGKGKNLTLCELEREGAVRLLSSRSDPEAPPALALMAPDSPLSSLATLRPAVALSDAVAADCTCADG